MLFGDITTCRKHLPWPVPTDHFAGEPAPDAPDGVEHRQIVYRVLFERPAEGRPVPRDPGDRLEWSLDNAGHKAPWPVGVDPAHTSRTGAACGHASAPSRGSRASFDCMACRHADHADLNAARNIPRRGLAQVHGEGRSHLATPEDP